MEFRCCNRTKYVYKGSEHLVSWIANVKLYETRRGWYISDVTGLRD